MGRLLAVLALILCGCASAYPPPSLPEINPPITFAPQAELPALCHHKSSPWICACTVMDKPGRPIIMALPQDCPSNYAEIFEEEFAHHQRGLPDPPGTRDRLIRDELAR